MQLTDETKNELETELIETELCSEALMVEVEADQKRLKDKWDKKLSYDERTWALKNLLGIKDEEDEV